jgi:signal transduction histidine kinase/CheY-like chemotaxis protein
MSRFTVRRRILVLLGCVATAFLLLAYGWKRNEVAESDALLAQQLRDTKHLVSSALELRRSSYVKFVRDYSSRTKVIDHVLTPGSNPASAALDAASATFGVDGIFLFDLRGKQVYRLPDTAAGGAPIAMMPLDASRFADAFDGTTFSHFFARQGHELLEVHGATIQRAGDAERPAEKLGYFFAIKRWDAEYIEGLRSITGCQVAVAWPVDHRAALASRAERGIIIDRILSGARAEKVAMLTATRAIPALELVTHTTNRALSLLVAFTILSFIALTYGIYRFIGLPLQTLTVALDRTDSGMLVPLAKAGHEFGNFARLMREFFEQRAALQQEVERRRASEIELAKIGRRAEAAAQARIKVFAEVSHEIRSPLAGVIGMIDLLAGTDLSPQQRDFVATIQGSAKTMLGTLNDVLDFAKIEEGKIVIERIDFDLREVAEEVVALFAAQAQAKGLELATVVPADAVTWLAGDPGRFRQILINLVGNAVKYTERGEVVIDVAVASIDNERFRVAVCVRDTGVGIPPERLETIFDAFEQASASDSRRHGGTGLGLTISRQFARLLGGELSATSLMGHGSAFTLECTVRRASVARDLDPTPARTLAIIASGSATFRRSVAQQVRALGCAVVEADGLDGVGPALESSDANLDPAVLIFDHRRTEGSFTEQIKNARRAANAVHCRHIFAAVTFSESAAFMRAAAAHGVEFLARPIASRSLQDALVRVSARSDEPPRVTRTAKPSKSLAGLRVLLAESYPPTQRLLLDHARELGVQATLATDGAMALEQLTNERFDAAIVDLRLLEMDGLDVVRRFREVERTRGGARLPIAALNAPECDREKWSRAGVDVSVRTLASTQVFAAALAEALELDSVAGSDTGKGAHNL